MSMLFHLIIAYGMFYTSFSGNVKDIHRSPDTSSSFKYSFVGGYTAFGVPFARFSTSYRDYIFHLFALTSGKMAKTDAQGSIIGSFYYNGIILSAGKTVYKDLKNIVYIEPGIYLESADGWYNPGIGVNIKYRRCVYDAIYGEVNLKNAGFSLNPRDLIDFDAILSLTYLKYGIDPFFSIDMSPNRGLYYYMGVSLPLHRLFSFNIYYTNAYKEFKFGAGSDILNGLSLGMEAKLKFIKFMYITDFYGEGGITHSIELKFLR